MRHLLIIMILTGCSDAIKTIEADGFNIQVPETWELEEVDGLDSYVGYIHTGTDTLRFDFGWYSNDLSEEIEHLVYVPEGIELDEQEGTNYAPIGTDPDKFRKQNVFYENIGGLEAKITLPRRIGDGLTGVHFTTTGEDSDDPRDKLTIYVYDLDPTLQDDVLEAFRTIRFH